MLTIATAITNRLISNKNVSFDFIEPFNFTSEILNRPARQRGEIRGQNSSKNSLNPIECPRQESNLHRSLRRAAFYPLNYEDTPSKQKTRFGTSLIIS